jgi:hypothetical protein
MLQKYGYLQFHYAGDDHFVSVPYNDLAGKTATVIALTSNSRLKDNFEIRLSVDDTQKTVVSQIGLDGLIDNAAPLVDLQSARNAWVGKSVWTLLSRYYVLTGWEHNYQTHSRLDGSVAVKKYSMVRITDVLAGNSAFKPVRIVFRTPASEEVFIDVSVSHTGFQAHSSQTFYTAFSDVDPYSLHKWSRGIWNAIENDEVILGMTTEQVRASRGEPLKINQTFIRGLAHEQWVYGHGDVVTGYVYFDNDRVSAIQLDGG